MAFQYNSEVKPENRVEPIVFMPHEDQIEEEEISVDDLMEKGLG